MERPTISVAQEAEIYETVQRELRQIWKAAHKMDRSISGLSGVSQKQAIAQFVAHWIKDAYPNDRAMALLLSEHMREQVDVYLVEAAGEPLN